MKLSFMKPYLQPLRRALPHIVIFAFTHLVSVCLKEIWKATPSTENAFHFLWWTSKYDYLHLWLLAVLLVLYKKNTWAWCITVSNTLGVLSGQLLMNFLQNSGLFPDVRLRYCPGVHIWLHFALAGILIGGLAELLLYQGRKRRNGRLE